MPRAASVSAPEAVRSGCPAIRKLTFEPRKRLHQPAEFSAVRQRGRRFADAYFSVSVLKNKAPHARLGLAMATRICGGSVPRNRIKRLTRESFRLHQHELPPVDITVAAREAARNAQARDLVASLAQLWARAARER